MKAKNVDSLQFSIAFRSVRGRVRVAFAFCGLVCLSLLTASMAGADERPRLIVLADMGHDPDEEQQMIHLLMNSNEVDIEGLILVTGRFFRPNPTDSTKWLQPHLFHRIIDGYAEVLPNLRLHAEGWPEPEYLHGVVANGQTGNGMMDVGEGRWSRGARLITEALRRDDPRPLHIVVNAGSNTLAQTLYELRAEHKPEEAAALVAKLRVFDNGGQDEAGAWILHEFPEINWIRGNEQTRGYGGPSNNLLGPQVWEPYTYTPEGQHDWAKEHVQTGHGALGELYPDRYVEQFHFIEGGGTIPWMRLVSPGLTDPNEPSWGGWSGRYSAEKVANPLSPRAIVRADERKYLPFASITDAEGVSDRWVDPESGIEYDSVYAGVWRWRRAMWNNFQARMDWCVKPFAEANHHPVAVLDGDASDAIVRRRASVGNRLPFDASGSTDPDGDSLRYRWWVYPEAGTRPYGKGLPINGADQAQIELQVPADAAGKQLHLILEVWDESPIAPLVDYRRVVIDVE